MALLTDNSIELYDKQHLRQPACQMKKYVKESRSQKTYSFTFIDKIEYRSLDKEKKFFDSQWFHDE